MAGSLKKGKGIIIDGTDKNSIAAAAQDKNVDIIVNAMPIEIGKGVLGAAMMAKTNYQDFCAPYGFHKEGWTKGFHFAPGMPR